MTVKMFTPEALAKFRAFVEEDQKSWPKPVTGAADNEFVAVNVNAPVNTFTAIGESLLVFDKYGDSLDDAIDWSKLGFSICATPTLVG
jgi:hypothetical protein